jgi:uncharacterized protein (DUF1697 family)
MTATIVLLRGINVGGHNLIPMTELRKLLSGAGFGDVRTYLQSGNVVLSSDAAPDRVAADCQRLIADRFGREIAIIVRTRAELANVVRRNPLGDVAVDPKRHLVTFLAANLDSAHIRRLEAAVVEPEQLLVSAREIYAWLPAGVARSRLWTLLAGRDLGVMATARNWTTVTKLLEMADA